MREGFDIFILAGQSNAIGCGVGMAEEDYVPRKEICSLDVDINVVDTGHGLRITYPDTPFKLTEARERIDEKGDVVGDLSLSFAAEYVKRGYLEAGRKVLLVRCAVGGTGFAKGHWGEEDILYLKMLEMVDYALALSPNNRIKGLLWHQGEHDAVEGNTPSVFHKQLKTLFENVKERYACPELPIIAGDFCHEWKNKNLEICNPIVHEIKEVIKEVGHAGFTESNGLLSNNQTVGNGDDIHFSKESLRILGKRYFQEYERIR